MAIRAVLAVDNNSVISGQRASFTITVSNPSGGTDTTLTLLKPNATPNTASHTFGRPLLSIPEAPYFLGAGLSVTFQFSGEFFVGQVTPAQANAPANSFPITVGCTVYASDGTVTYPALCNMFVFPAGGMNLNTAIALPLPGSANFAAN